MGFVGLCLLVGSADGALTARAVRGWYLSLERPPLTPPNWVFGPVWTVLYVMIGVAAWLVWKRQGAGRALRVWGWQLAVNAVWSPVFFALHRVGVALAVVAALVAAVVLTIRAFAPVHRIAAWMLAPYLAWACFAAYLNAGFWWLNR